MRTTLLKRPILVWIIVLFFSVPALFFVVTNTLVLTGVISPPANVEADYFTTIDPVTRAISIAEALFLLVAMATLLAMSRLALPLCVLSFAVDLIHNLSGKYLEEPTTVAELMLFAIIDVAVVAYVWRLKRQGQLR